MLRVYGRKSGYFRMGESKIIFKKLTFEIGPD